MPTGRLSGRRRRFGDVAVPPERQARLADGSAVTLRLWRRDPRGDRVTVVAEDAGGRIVGRTGFTRVYGPRAELSLALGEDFWCSGLAEVLVATLCHVAAQQGISVLLLRLPASDERVGTILVEQFGAREVRAGDAADLELATALPPA
jgi:hypothetical protein